MTFDGAPATAAPDAGGTEDAGDPEEAGGTGQPDGGPGAPSTLNRDILDALTDLVKRAGTVIHSLAAGVGVAPSDLHALFKLDGALAMKELARRMGCDASFVTVVADTLEGHGFIRREPGRRDRRVKHLVLTPAGAAARERLFGQLAAEMPWCYGLSDAERQCLLGLLRKMLDAPRPAAAGEQGGAGEAATDRSG